MRRFAPTTLCLLLALSLFPSRTRAEVQDITVAVDGVVCPVCAHSLNMGLRRLYGVKSVKVLMGARVNLDIRLHPGVWVDPNSLFQQISQVGYRARPNEVKLRLRGMVTDSGDGLILTLSDIAPRPVQFLLVPMEATGKHGDEIKASAVTLKEAVKASNKGTRSVEVEGWWRSAKAPGQPATLQMTKAELLPQSGSEEKT